VKEHRNKQRQKNGKEKKISINQSNAKEIKTRREKGRNKCKTKIK
jgi:hypothetical protein